MPLIQITPSSLGILSWAHQALGNYFLDRKNWTSALEEYQACLAFRLSLAKVRKIGSLNTILLGLTTSLGAFYFTSGQTNLPKATHYYENAYDIREKLAFMLIRATKGGKRTLRYLSRRWAILPERKAIPKKHAQTMMRPERYCRPWSIAIRQVVVG